MTRSSDAEQIEALTRQVAMLTDRLWRLESYVGQLPIPRGPWNATPVATPPPSPPGARPPAAAPIGAGDTVRATVPAAPPSAWWQVGPLREVAPERLPAVALAAAGGLALMFGLLFFVGYAVDQGWLAPALRVALGGAVGVALIGVAWWLAPRQRAVAGALGGAGLGSWFGAWLVSRHVHGFVGYTEAFVALALGCAACLVVAGHRHLRMMAFLAGLAAYVTPVATSTGADRLHELMIYQVVLMGALWGLEQARKWPELVMLALVGTWSLMLGWAADHLGSRAGEEVLPWCAAVFALGALQAMQAARKGRVGTALARYVVGGIFAWIAVTWAAASDEGLLAASTGVMALGHLAVLAWAWRSERPRAVRLAPLTFAWLQAFAFAPLAFDEIGMALWWSGQATIAVAVFARRPGWGAMRLWLVPGLAVVTWAATHDGFGLAVAVGAVAVLGLLVMGGWDKTLEPAIAAEHGLAPHGQRALTWTAAAGGLVIWAGITRAQLDAAGSVEPWPWWCALAMAAWVGWSLWRPTPARVQVALSSIAAVVGVAVVEGAEHGAWGLHAAAAGHRRFIELAVAAAVVASIGVVVALRRRRPQPTAQHTWGLHDAAGALAGVAFAVLAALGWTAFVQRFVLDPDAAASLQQAGLSVVGAGVGLGWVVAGLRLDRGRWRQLGVTTLFVVAAKVVLVDLGQVDLAWRVVSFLGLGACLIAGAGAYGRFERRVRPAVPPDPASLA